jgi:hypothetical protein
MVMTWLILSVSTQRYQSMKNNQLPPHDVTEFLDLEDESTVKALFREWLADQFSPEKNSENRRLNNQEEFKLFRRHLRSYLPLIISYLVVFLLLSFLETIGLILTIVIALTLMIFYIIQGLRAARRGMSNRIRSNKSKSLRLNSEAVVLLNLIPEETASDDVLKAFGEIDSELKSQNSIDRTLLSFFSKILTSGPLTLFALAYLLKLMTTMDPKAFIEGNKVWGTDLGYIIAMGLVVAFINDYLVVARTLRSERIAQIISRAQNAYQRSVKPSPDSTDK